MYEIEYTPNFTNQLKRLMKKYPKSEVLFQEIIERLENGESVGTPYNNLGLPVDEDVYKVMVANLDTNRSAKNGFRVIYYVIKNDIIYLLAVYSKNEMSNLKQSEVKNLIKKFC